MANDKTYNYQPMDGFYDIESVEDAWTFSHYSPLNNIVNVFILWGSDKLEKLSDHDKLLIRQKILDVNPKLAETHAKINIFDGITELVYYLAPLFGDQLPFNSSVHETLSHITNPYTGKSLTTNPFVDEVGDNDTSIHTYQFGFNSKSYDMGVLAFVLEQWAEGNLPVNPLDWTDTSHHITPATIKDISNKVINADYPSQVTELSYRSNAGKVLQAMTKSTRFVDIRLLLGKSAKLTLGLKRYAAQAGWQILESELVKSQESLRKITTTINADRKLNPDTVDQPDVTPVDLLADMIGYNVLDVLNSKRLFEMDDWQTGFKQHLQLLDRFEDSFEGKLYVDSTNSKFIEYVIVPNNGGKPVRLKDSESINLTFPTVNGNEDILEVAKKLGLPDEVYAFYDNYRNAKTTGGKQAVEIGKENVLKDARLDKAKEEGRLSDKGTTLDVWVTDESGNVNNSHINVSVGGAHGEYASFDDYVEKLDYIETFEKEQAALEEHYHTLISNNPDLSEKDNEKETRRLRLEFSRDVKAGDTLPNGTIPMNTLATVNSKRVTLKKAPTFSMVPSDYVKTVFAKDVIHADVDSLYPTLLTLLKTLLRNDGKDVYGDLRNERLKLKASLPEHKASYTDKDWEINAIQLLNKLLLNSATGAADANFDTNILVSNKITSMRIIGNLLIYILSMKLASIGGTLVSINTDGLYVYGISKQEADVVIKEWREYFNLSASPEVVNRFISKDTNNRIEVSGNKLDYAGGGSFSAWKKPSLMKSVAKPAMMDEALVNYMWKEADPLATFDRKAVHSYIQSRIDHATSQEEKEELLLKFQWIFAGSPSKNRHYYAFDNDTKEYTALSNISRAFITKPDYSNVSIKLISAAKGNAVDDQTAHDLLINDKVQLNFEQGQHLITTQELAVDNIINDVKLLKKSKTDVAEYYANHKEELDNAVETMNIPAGQYAPLAMVGDFKTFTDFFKNAYKARMIGTDSSILRTSFIASPRVNSEMRFIVDNNGLDQIASSDLLNNIDVDAYVDLVQSEWSLWSENYADLWH